MKASVMVAVDVYVKHTDKDGRSFVQVHRAWDRDLFLQSLAKAAVEAGGKAKAEAITEQQYERARKRR